jgi:hypothetical protein
MTLVPSTVDDTMIFGEVFGEHADSREVRPVETGAAHLTIDIMGHIVLGIDLNSQREENELVEAFRIQISWTSNITLNPFRGINPLRPFMHKYYESKMNNYLERVLIIAMPLTQLETQSNLAVNQQSILH